MRRNVLRSAIRAARQGEHRARVRLLRRHIDPLPGLAHRQPRLDVPGAEKPPFGSGVQGIGVRARIAAHRPARSPPTGPGSDPAGSATSGMPSSSP